VGNMEIKRTIQKKYLRGGKTRIENHLYSLIDNQIINGFSFSNSIVIQKCKCIPEVLAME
jgi:hypothetical protein